MKVVVTNQPHSLRHNGVDLVSGVSALLAWFPASWTSKIAPCFKREEEASFACPHRVFEGLQRDAVNQVLQAVKFFFFPSNAFMASAMFQSMLQLGLTN